MHRIRNAVPMRLFLSRIATVATLLYFCVPSGAMAQESQSPDSSGQPAATTPTAYIYWTNYQASSVGRATKTATGLNNNFIPSVGSSGVVGGGMTLNSQYIYWTSANGGTARTILRANLSGTGVNKKFITTAANVNPCGVTVDTSYIYWAGDGGMAIGRAKLNGTGVNQNFIATGSGVCGVVVTSTHVYWANYRSGWIGRANLNGTDPNPNFIQTMAASGIAIEGPYIYWANSQVPKGSIGRATLNGTDVKQNFIKGVNGEVGFLAVDSTYIYWADWGSRGSGTTIGRAKLNGTGVNQSFIKGTKGGFGIAVTAGSP
jgi:virginiamycin B lyase